MMMMMLVRGVPIFYYLRHDYGLGNIYGGSRNLKEPDRHVVPLSTNSVRRLATWLVYDRTDSSFILTFRDDNDMGISRLVLRQRFSSHRGHIKVIMCI